MNDLLFVIKFLQLTYVLLELHNNSYKFYKNPSPPPILIIFLVMI